MKEFALKNFLSFITEDLDYIRDISHFHIIPNSQKGTNPGAVMKHPVTGEHHYVKFYSNHNQARSEVAAGGIYNMLGAKTVNPYLAKYNGHVGVGSKWNPDLAPLKSHDFNGLPDTHLHDLANHFHAAVLTKNWDVDHTSHNIMKHKYDDQYHASDLGGTFEHRGGGGGHKDYGSDVMEFHSLRNRAVNPYASTVFKGLTAAHMAHTKPNLQSLSHEKVHTLFSTVGLNNPADKTATLMARRDLLLKKI